MHLWMRTNTGNKWPERGVMVRDGPTDPQVRWQILRRNINKTSGVFTPLTRNQKYAVTVQHHRRPVKHVGTSPKKH
jgi:hypothetical protein